MRTLGKVLLWIGGILAAIFGVTLLLAGPQQALVVVEAAITVAFWGVFIIAALFFFLWLTTPS